MTRTHIPFTNGLYIVCVGNICLEIITKLVSAMTTTQYYVKIFDSEMSLVKVHSDEISHKRYFTVSQRACWPGVSSSSSFLFLLIFTCVLII